MENSNQAGNLYAEALHLSRDDRAQLAERLLASLDDKPWSWENADPEWRSAWESEITRRIEDVKTGKTSLVDGEEVFRRIKQQLSS